MKLISTKDFINKLNLYAFLLEFSEENQFKINAIKNAANYLSNNENIDICEHNSINSVKNLPGFGNSLTNITKQYCETGTFLQLEELSKVYPESLFDLLKVKGLGFKKIKLLYEKLNITNLNELDLAFQNGEIKNIKSISGEQSEVIFNSLTHVQAGKNKILQDECNALTEKLINILKKVKGINKVELAGEVRRFKEIISTIDILIESNESEIIFSNEINNLLNEINATGVKLNIIIENKLNYYFTLHKLTASEEYYNYFESKFDTNKILNKSFKSEADLFKALSIQYIPPEIRENSNSINLAIENKIKTLIEDNDLKGMIHIHTDWSDGHNTYEQMVMKCDEMGFKYVAICDHSKSSYFVNGLTEKRIFEQFELIEKLKPKFPNIQILKGIECDILPNGDLDYTDEILAEFDIVVASIHSNFNLGIDIMTNRLIKAIESPYIKIIAHPTGRILKTRAGYQIDIDKFIDACAYNNKVIEINSNPYRLDFSYSNCIKAKEKGVKFAINPDSHKTSTLKDIYIGTKVAKKAMLTKADVINCLNYDEFVKLYCK